MSGTSAHATFTTYIVDTGIPYLPRVLQMVHFRERYRIEADALNCSGVHPVTFDPVKRRAYYGYKRFHAKGEEQRFAFVSIGKKATIMRLMDLHAVRLQPLNAASLNNLKPQPHRLRRRI
jgi:hypothetical protein